MGLFAVEAFGKKASTQARISTLGGNPGCFGPHSHHKVKALADLRMQSLATFPQNLRHPIRAGPETIGLDHLHLLLELCDETALFTQLLLFPAQQRPQLL